MTGQPRRKQQPHPMDLHLLANPGDSLLVQRTLDHLIRWLYPSLRMFHVSERASSLRTPTRIGAVAGKGLFGVLLRLYLHTSDQKSSTSLAFVFSVE